MLQFFILTVIFCRQAKQLNPSCFLPHHKSQEKAHMALQATLQALSALSELSNKSV